MRHAGSTQAPITRVALAIVAKFPVPGSVKTRLGASIGMGAAAELYRAFLLDLRHRFTPAQHELRYDLHWAYTPYVRSLAEVVGNDARLLAQRGADFSERLLLVCRDLRTAGYRRAVIMSSDSPHIREATVARALALLETTEVVLGPADDGGYYLIGLGLEPEPPDLFTGIAMSTPTVLAETLARAEVLNLSTALLEPTFDVDEVADLERLQAFLAVAGGSVDDGQPPFCAHTCAALASLALGQPPEVNGALASGRTS
jgi:rSAM/selenodomain-associated transferase 1